MNVPHHGGDHRVTVREHFLHLGGDHRVRGCFPVVAAGGLDLPGSCGPSLARIEFDNWDFLSRCLFAEK